MCRRRFPARPPFVSVAAAIALVALAAGCATAVHRIEPTPPVPPVAALLVEPTGRVELLDDGDAASLRAAVEQSLAWLAAAPRDTTFDYGVRRVSAAHLSAALGALRDFLGTGPDGAALRDWIAARFDVVGERG
jgi:membrane-bound lytic murein transglycosylase A